MIEIDCGDADQPVIEPTAWKSHFESTRAAETSLFAGSRLFVMGLFVVRLTVIDLPAVAAEPFMVVNSLLFTRIGTFVTAVTGYLTCSGFRIVAQPTSHGIGVPARPGDFAPFAHCLSCYGPV